MVETEHLLIGHDLLNSWWKTSHHPENQVKVVLKEGVVPSHHPKNQVKVVLKEGVVPSQGFIYMELWRFQKKMAMKEGWSPTMMDFHQEWNLTLKTL